MPIRKFIRKDVLYIIIMTLISKILKKNWNYQVKVKDIKTPIIMRSLSTDKWVFKQVFVNNEYSFRIKEQPSVIIDAGANTGMASIYFANKFPDAKIIAIEPENGNYSILLKNTSSYPNITPIKAALWNKEGIISVIDIGLGSWGFITEEQTNSNTNIDDTNSVKAITINSILNRFGIDKIDILKIDIEGAEKEVFSDSAKWLDKTETIIAELHDRMKPGCSRVFYANSNGFDQEWVKGENVYLSRGNCSPQNYE